MGKDALYKSHFEVFRSALPGCEKQIEAFFDSLGEELANVLPEQRKSVIDNLDIKKVTEELWNTE